MVSLLRFGYDSKDCEKGYFYSRTSLQDNSNNHKLRHLNYLIAPVFGFAKGAFGALFTPIHTPIDTASTARKIDAYLMSRNHLAKKNESALSKIINYSVLESIVGGITYAGVIGTSIVQIAEEPSNPISYLPVATASLGTITRSIKDVVKRYFYNEK